MVASTPIAAAFDVPLQPQQVLSLLGSFVSGCDLAGALGITRELRCCE